MESNMYYSLQSIGIQLERLAHNFSRLPIAVWWKERTSSLPDLDPFGRVQSYESPQLGKDNES